MWFKIIILEKVADIVASLIDIFEYIGEEDFDGNSYEITQNFINVIDMSLNFLLDDLDFNMKSSNVNVYAIVAKSSSSIMQSLSQMVGAREGLIDLSHLVMKSHKI